MKLALEGAALAANLFEFLLVLLERRAQGTHRLDLVGQIAEERTLTLELDALLIFRIVELLFPACEFLLEGLRDFLASFRGSLLDDLGKGGRLHPRRVVLVVVAGRAGSLVEGLLELVDALVLLGQRGTEFFFALLKLRDRGRDLLFEPEIGLVAFAYLGEHVLLEEPKLLAVLALIQYPNKDGAEEKGGGGNQNYKHRHGEDPGEGLEGKDSAPFVNRFRHTVVPNLELRLAPDLPDSFREASQFVHRVETPDHELFSRSVSVQSLQPHEVRDEFEHREVEYVARRLRSRLPVLLVLALTQLFVCKPQVIDGVGLKLRRFLEAFRVCEALLLEVVDGVQYDSMPCREPDCHVARAPALGALRAIDQHLGSLKVEHLDQVRTFEIEEGTNAVRKNAFCVRAVRCAVVSTHRVEHFTSRLVLPDYAGEHLLHRFV